MKSRNVLLLALTCLLLFAFIVPSVKATTSVSASASQPFYVPVDLSAYGHRQSCIGLPSISSNYLFSGVDYLGGIDSAGVYNVSLNIYLQVGQTALCHYISDQKTVYVKLICPVVGDFNVTLTIGQTSPFTNPDYVRVLVHITEAVNYWFLIGVGFSGFLGTMLIVVARSKLSKG